MGAEEWKRVKERVVAAFRGERMVKWVVILGLCGIALLFLSSFLEESGEGDRAPSPRPSQAAASAAALEEDLCRVVAAVTGEDSPTVVVTLENDGETLYAEDGRSSSQGGEGPSQEREDTHVLLEDADGNQRALAVSQSQPQVRGVVVVSSAAGEPAVREKLLTAVCTALDLPASRVCVLSGAPR